MPNDRMWRIEVNPMTDKTWRPFELDLVDQIITDLDNTGHMLVALRNLRIRAYDQIDRCDA